MIPQLTFEQFNLNVVGVVHTMNVFLPLVKKNPIQKVIVIGSGISDIHTAPRFRYAVTTPYCTSKAVVNLVVSKYGVAYKAHGGPLFLALSPGLVNTSRVPPKPEEVEEFAAAAAASLKSYNPQ
ncbi:hypothetical protein EWM64_g6552 [Hericium alpestre]|uniref:Uncharacterized protein n=1 Tax=Hericium alpestre TaxID=135208 RepID=A0A4Y9ZVC0_9AGAM|nr:hypothetical protein EWM64_g6552 [Hericium alpestre]